MASPLTPQLTEAELAAAVTSVMAADFDDNVAARVGARLKADRITGRVFASLTKEEVAEVFPGLAWGERRTLWLLVQQAARARSVAPPAAQAGMPSAVAVVPAGGVASVVAAGSAASGQATVPAPSQTGASVAPSVGDEGIAPVARNSLLPVPLSVPASALPTSVPAATPTRAPSDGSTRPLDELLSRSGSRVGGGLPSALASTGAPAEAVAAAKKPVVLEQLASAYMDADEPSTDGESADSDLGFTSAGRSGSGGSSSESQAVAFSSASNSVSFGAVPASLATKRPRSPSSDGAAKRARMGPDGSVGAADEISPARSTPTIALADAATTAAAVDAASPAPAVDESPQPPPTPSPPPPEFLLGICGPTGAGKSTVLNALLDGCNILPTSAMHACTAVPIEVRYRAPSDVNGARVSPDDPELDNLEQLLSEDAEGDADLDDTGDSDGRFSAEIEFIGEDQWLAMLTTAADMVRRKAERRQTLEANLTQAGVAADPSARQLALEQFCDDEDVDDAGSSHLAAVKAVLNGDLFPSVAEFQAHCQTSTVQAVLRFLGQSLRFYGDRPADISWRITRFLATTTGSTAAPSVWPLVRKAVVAGPWALLSGGLTIVDLPGLGDANSARNAVVSGYIDRCHGILAAAPITRARDNKTTKDIFSGARAGLRAGRIQYLAFLATQVDNCDPAEIVSELGGDFSRHYRKGLELHQSRLLDSGLFLPTMTPAAVLLREVRDAEAHVALLKKTRDTSGAVDEAILLAAQADAAEKARLLRSYCVTARNGFVGAAIAAQYKEDMADVLLPTSPPSVRELSVFSVSAVEYEKIMREGGGNADLSSSFTVARATGIPSLRDALWSLSNTSAEVRARGEEETRIAYAVRPDATAEAADLMNIDGEELEKFLTGLLNEDQEQDASDESSALAPDVLRKLMEQEAEAAAARRRAAVQDSTKAVQDRTQYLQRISTMNTRAATALDRFLSHCSSSATLVASKRRLDVWTKQAKELMSSKSGANDSSALIAVLGDSGAGKSTLLNALLDVSEPVLPVSGVRACTAAPIEISHYVGPPGARYEATVEFLSEEDWEGELTVLLSDLADDGGVIRRNMERPRTEGGRLAYDKVVSLYGRVGSLKELRQVNATQGWLGTTVTLKATAPQFIRQQLEDYVSSKSADGVRGGGGSSQAGRLWPIVKVARLRGPFAVLANCGGRLLDLPGLQDSNEARNAVIQSYLTKCSAFLIAAPIRRAIDNRTARQLLGRQFRRQLLLDGRVGTVAFVATATDDLDALHVAAELGIKGVSRYSGSSEEQVQAQLRTHAPHIKRLRKRVAVLGKRRANCESASRRVSNALDASVTARDNGIISAHEHATAVARHRAKIRRLEGDLNMLRTAINQAQTDLRRREHVVNLLCATARNAFCRVQLRADFAEGIRDVMSASLLASGSSQAPEAGSEVADVVPELPVFTVSSRDYRCLTQQTGEAAAFYTPAQTEVPRLRDYVRQALLVKSAANEVTRADRIELLLTSVCQYLTLSDRATPAQQLSLGKATQELTKKTGSQLSDVALRTRARLEQVLLLGPLAQALDLGDLKARRMAPRSLAATESSMHWASFRACIKRNGEYCSPTAGQINLNESLAAPLMETAMQTWRQTFGTGVPKMLLVLKTDASRVIEKTLESVVAAVRKEGLSAAPLSTDLGLTVRRSFELEVAASTKAAELKVETFQRAAWAAVSARVRNSLAPAYELGGAESGSGCVARLKAHMRAGVERQRLVMFKAAVAEMHKRMQGLTLQVEQELSTALTVHARAMLDSVQMVWDADCGLSADQCAALVATLSTLSSFVRSVGAAAFALRSAMDSATGTDFDASDSHTSVLPVLTDLGGGDAGGALLSDAAVRAVVAPRPRPQQSWTADANCRCDNCERKRAPLAAAGASASSQAKREGY